MDQPLSDKTLVARRFARSTATYHRAAIVQREMAQRLVQYVADAATTQAFDNVLELGCGTGLLTDLLVRQFAIRRLVLNDIVPDLDALAARCAGAQPELQIARLPGDMESVTLPANQHLVISNAVLQWAADADTMLRRMIAAVRPGGLLAIATFGPSNLSETRQLTGTALHYLSLSEIEAQLAADTSILVRDERIRTVSFKTAYAVLQHLKRTGVNGLRRGSWSPRAFREFCDLYESRFRDGNRVPLTYHPITIVARRHRT